VSEARTDELSVLTDENLKYLPRETRQYIKKILLVAMIGENLTLGFSNDKNDDLENSLIQVEVLAGTSLKDIAVLLKMKEKKLFDLNKGLKNGVVPHDKAIYKITIPIEKVYAFYLRYDLPIVEKRYKSHMISHNVRLGETLEDIAKYYDADKEEIKRSNHLVDDFLIVDALLVIPVTKNIFEKVSR
jgi:membrane-bound lytic murein transglycosylase D